MLLDDVEHDGQAEPGPLVLRREERLEDLVRGLAGHARAGVRDADPDRGVLLVGADRQFAGSRHRVDGVGEEVEEDLLELLGVDADDDLLRDEREHAAGRR